MALSGREPKQTVVVSDSDEAHFDAITNLEGGCFTQPLILVVYGASYKHRVEFKFLVNTTQSSHYSATYTLKSNGCFKGLFVLV